MGGVGHRGVSGGDNIEEQELEIAERERYSAR
jgi:hypothetical protein